MRHGPLQPARTHTCSSSIRPRNKPALTRALFYVIISPPFDGGLFMAKGQMRSNKEKRKPKKEKDDKKGAKK
jgi:hypothetical protein